MQALWPEVAGAAWAKPIRNQLWIGGFTVLLLFAGCNRPALRRIEALESQGKIDQALHLTEEALGFENSTGRTHWQLLLEKAELLKEADRLEAALAWLKQFSPFAGADDDLRTLLLREEASYEAALGRFRDADQHLLLAKDTAVHTGDANMAARLEIRRAYVLIQLHQLGGAEQCLAKAEEYARTTHDHSLEPFTLHYRGELLATAGHFEDAVALLEKSLAAFRKPNQNARAANVMVSLGWCYYQLGQFDKALGLYNEALELADPEDRHLVFGSLGNLYSAERDFAKAADYYRKAAALAKGRRQDFEATWLSDLAQALIEQQKWTEAEQFNNQALALEKQIDRAETQPWAVLNAGRIEAHKGEYQKAERILQQLGETEGDISARLNAYSSLASLYLSKHQLSDAKRGFEAGLDLADGTSGSLHNDENRLSYLSSLIDVHHEYVKFLMDYGDQAAAFAAAESSRAGLLRERLNVRHSKIRNHKVAEYQAAAQASGTTFLAYWVGRAGSYLWAISGTQFTSFSLPPESEIRTLVDRYQAGIERAGPLRPEESKAGAKLFQVLLAAHPGVLKPGGKYVVVPDGPLYALNFETLPVPGDPPQYWIEDATIAVAPSLELLLTRRMKPRSDRSLLLVGDAIQWNSEYPKLLHAQQEMEGIEKQFSGVRQEVLRGAAATPAAYMRSQPGDYAYIQFTAHATANRNSPFDSAIILSKENNSGKLLAKQVLNTPVTAELVTISACHSAGARTYAGEGLVGFAWAFLQSGAHGVIAGLWDVSDYSSPRIMQDLYAGLAASMPPAEALRYAKLNLIRGVKYGDPYYWGAFQFYEGALESHPAVSISAGLRSSLATASRNSR